MSNQPEYEYQDQQSETITPEEVRQALLAEIDASKRAIEELSDGQLETIVGAGGCIGCIDKVVDKGDAALARKNGVPAYYQVLRDNGWNRWHAAGEAIINGPSLGAQVHDSGRGNSVEHIKNQIAASFPSNRPMLNGTPQVLYTTHLLDKR
jgi:hypothetical protein